MKILNTFVISFICFGLTSCTPDSAVVPNSGRSIIMDETGSFMGLKVIILDGNEYYATKSAEGYWNLCPKLSTKTELNNN